MIGGVIMDNFQHILWER